jgi:hypothetical protein
VKRPSIYLMAVALVATCFSASAAKRPADGRLAYVQYLDKGCQVGVWDSKAKASRILGPLAECPAAVSVTSHERALVLIFANSIRLVDIEGGKIGDPIPMPADASTKARDDEASLAGYTADGTLALYLRDIKPDSSNISHLFLFKKGSWVTADERSCGQYDDCTLSPAMQARQLDDIYGVGPNGLFNESLTNDPYVTHRSIKDGRMDAGPDAEPNEDVYPTDVSLTFHVDGRDSQVQFATAPGEDAGGVYTFGLKFALPDSRTLTVTPAEQYGAALVGHYLFYHGFFGDGVRLYDVGTGEVVLDKLSTGGWLESAPTPSPGTAPPP